MALQHDLFLAFDFSDIPRGAQGLLSALCLRVTFGSV